MEREREETQLAFCPQKQRKAKTEKTGEMVSLELIDDDGVVQPSFSPLTLPFLLCTFFTIAPPSPFFFKTHFTFSSLS
jgi:hypothetical protein